MTDTAAFVAPRRPQAHLAFPHPYRSLPHCPGCAAANAAATPAPVKIDR